MRKFFDSVRCANQGIRHSLRTEKNIRIHLVVFTLALFAAYVFKISKAEFLVILVISAVTLSLELCNTAIERLADKVSPRHDAQIAVVKDVMAGAVLVSSIFAIVIGCIIFFEPMLKLFQH